VTTNPELPEAVKQLLHDTMREEYEIGVTDGLSICLRGLERSLPDYTNVNPALEPGIREAIELIRSALEERPQATKDKGVHALYAKN
jgi:hypothetical protein